MKAREILAEAHQRMTPSAMKEQALAMADVIEAQHSRIGSLCRLLTQLGAELDRIQSGVQEVERLPLDRKKLAARQHLHRLAAEPTRDLSLLAQATTVSPLERRIFDPTAPAGVTLDGH